jgi:hypothetical protein
MVTGAPRASLYIPIAFSGKLVLSSRSRHALQQMLCCPAANQPFAAALAEFQFGQPLLLDRMQQARRRDAARQVAVFSCGLNEPLNHFRVWISDF